MLFLVVISITLMALDTKVAAVDRIRNALTVTLLPLQYLVSEPVQLIGKINNIITSHDNLVRENIDLRAKQLLLKAQVQRLLAIESENNQLKALVSSSTQIQGKVLIAQLLAIDSDPFIHQMVLNKGTQDGVYIGQPVLDANGVMGKIIQIAPYSSRVLLINDPHSGLPIQMTRTGLRAIAMGDGYTGKLKVINVTQTTDVRKGDVLVTSGLGDFFPEGYPVGVVSSVIKDPGLQFATVNVEPSARLDRARQVLLVWPTTRKPIDQETKPVENTVTDTDNSTKESKSQKNKKKNLDDKGVASTHANR